MTTRARLTAALLMAMMALLAAPALAAKPLKVFILAGQSNMQGQAHVRTFEHIGMDPETAPMLEEMQDADGEPTVCEDVWITAIGCADEEQVGRLTAGYGSAARGPKIGPEFTFGIYAHKLLDEPILLIKTAWGGKSINTDFRPPSAGPYVFNDAQLERFKAQGKNLDEITAAKAEATGHYYRLMLEHVKAVLADIKRVYPDYDADQGYELAGFIWFQGWNDMVDGSTYPNRGEPGGYDQYSEVLADFIRDVRKDLDAPEMPFVIGVMGAGGPIAKYPPEKQRYAGIHGEFRKAMAAPADLPEFQGNVAAVWTDECWDNQLSELVARNAKVGQKAKQLRDEGKLTREEQAIAVEAFKKELFTDEELEVLEKGVSNAEFHYLGSGKVMARIGKAFAEAVVELQKQ